MTSLELNRAILSAEPRGKWMQFGAYPTGVEPFAVKLPYVLFHHPGASGGACLVASAYLIAEMPVGGRDLDGLPEHYLSVPQLPKGWYDRRVILRDLKEEPLGLKSYVEKTGFCPWGPELGLWVSFKFYFDETPERVKEMVAEGVGLLEERLKVRV